MFVLFFGCQLLKGNDFSADFLLVLILSHLESDNINNIYTYNFFVGIFFTWYVIVLKQTVVKKCDTFSGYLEFYCLRLTYNNNYFINCLIW